MTDLEKVARAVASFEHSDVDGWVVWRYEAERLQSILLEHGLKIVPVEPTEEMIEATQNIASVTCGPTTKYPPNREDFINAYKAAIAAAPELK